MRMSHLQPGDITDRASCPVAECEDGGSAPIFLLLDQRAQNIKLILSKLSDANTCCEVRSTPLVGLRRSSPFASISYRAKLLMFDFTRTMVENEPLLF